jgi:hypothetical protein
LQKGTPDGFNLGYSELISFLSIIFRTLPFKTNLRGLFLSYIPIKIDYTDLFDVMAFFSGDLDGQNHHEHLAKQIADNGKDYTERFWRYEDMEACKFLPSLSSCRSSIHTYLSPPFH